MAEEWVENRSILELCLKKRISNQGNMSMDHVVETYVPDTEG